MKLVDVFWSLKCKHSTFSACLPSIISFCDVFLPSSYVYSCMLQEEGDPKTIDILDHH